MIPPIEPLSPFEVFRTPIQIRRFTDGFYLNGIWQEGSQVVLNTVLITGNVVHITYNGVSLASIPFTINLATTMALIQAALLAQPNVEQVNISTDNKTITVIPLPPNLSVVNSFTVTGGASQPLVTISNSPTIIASTASVQPLGKDVKLVPEGRRDSAEFKFYTSTEIFGITTQNPDQVTVLKAPFTGIVYEVININDWQNNANFNITNHYKFVALRLHPLPGVL
ncbi:MAG: hypothetical protein C5B43_04005 [Verrucomicrobia bacterium]|nr:MAG: hypothetical protein C5B43_04005 [Verrucomicrobiota bacterium]